MIEFSQETIINNEMKNNLFLKYIYSISVAKYVLQVYLSRSLDSVRHYNNTILVIKSIFLQFCIDIRFVKEKKIPKKSLT